MRINSIGSTQSFKAQLSPRVEEGFKKLSNGILAGYGADSKEDTEYLESLIKIKGTCPDATIDIEDYYESSKIEGGSLWSAYGNSSVHYNAYVLKTKYLPDVVLHKVNNTNDLFSLETFKQVADSVFMERASLSNNAVSTGDYLSNKSEKYLDDREKSTEYLEQDINPKTEEVFQLADEYKKWEYKPVPEPEVVSKSKKQIIKDIVSKIKERIKK